MTNVDWKSLLKKRYDNLSFFDPITMEELSNIKQNTGIELSGDLLELLKQTNGVKENMIVNNKIIEIGFFVYNSDRIIEMHKIHLEFLQKADINPPYDFLFFSDNGCGESFGFITKNGKIVSSQIGIYYPFDNEFRIIASNLMNWVTEWNGKS
jgi:hypothetical protein